jgi:hypothetical protein
MVAGQTKRLPPGKRSFGTLGRGLHASMFASRSSMGALSSGVGKKLPMEMSHRWPQHTNRTQTLSRKRGGAPTHPTIGVSFVLAASRTLSSRLFTSCHSHPGEASCDTACRCPGKRMRVAGQRASKAMRSRMETWDCKVLQGHALLFSHGDTHEGV